jgi:hypothetical protein
MAYFSLKYYRGWQLYVETLLDKGVYRVPPFTPSVIHLSHIHSNNSGNYLRHLAFALASSSSMIRPMDGHTHRVHRDRDEIGGGGCIYRVYIFC